MKMDKNSTSNALNLKYVHALLYRREFEKAIEALRLLSQSHPNFELYKVKLEQIQLDLTKRRLSGSRAPMEQSTESILESSAQMPTVGRGMELISQGRTREARMILSKLHESDKSNIEVIIALARADIIDERFSDALHKAKVVLSMNNLNRDAYRIAEQAAIELGQYDEANQYFLSQPPISNPPQPRKRGSNAVLPRGFVLPPIVGAGNDFRHILEQASVFAASGSPYEKMVSVIVPVFNRHRILSNTLAALVHQTYPRRLIEVIVVDDGSSDEVLPVIRKYEKILNLYYCRQPDKGYRLAAARNIGLRQARGDALIFMDADILPLPTDIESYMRVMHVSDQCVLIGHRRYVDVSELTDEMILNDVTAATSLPTINPNNDVADKRDATGASIDWRFSVYENTDHLRNDLWPFTKAAGGNIAFSRAIFERAGFVDEDFVDWGCEDGEHGYRLYNAGAYFVPMMDIVSLHQEPLDEQVAPTPGEESFRKKGHAITKKLLAQKCPAPTVRQYLPGLKFDVPKVSIYIPAHNASPFIKEAVQSCLDQNYGDLEVCICDDGSTDDTLKVITENFGADHRVRVVKQDNGGIAKSTNSAISLCRGMYIAQLDADDRLKPHAVRTCVAILDKSSVDAVYGDCDYIDGEGNYIRDGWCGGEFSREWMATGMIATHFRMFRKRLWSRTTGCNETLQNAVDLDLWLKFSERGEIEHVHEILYSYRWHGNNTSIRNRKLQERNHIRVITESFRRRRLDSFWSVVPTGNKLNPRELKIVPQPVFDRPRPSDVLFLIPSCHKFAAKADAIRNTWARQLSELGIRYFFLVGDPSLSAAKILKDTLHVPCRDDYESLLLKLVLGYEFLYRAVDFTYIYKIDDDCYPKLSYFLNDLLPQLAGVQYLAGATHRAGASMNNRWHFGKCSDPKFDVPYSLDKAPVTYAKGGYGYFLRKDVLPILTRLNETLREELANFIYSYEDVRIAEVLAAAGVEVTHARNYSCRQGDSGDDDKDYLVYDIKSPDVFFKIRDMRELEAARERSPLVHSTSENCAT